MSPRLVTALTFTFAGVVVGLYILFVVWRYRVDKRKKAMAAADVRHGDREERVLQRLAAEPPAAPAAAPPPKPASAPAPVPTTSPAAAPSMPPPEPSEATVADLLKGIHLPADLVPLMSIAPRADVGDRVAFWTKDIPAEAVSRDFAGELVRLGFAVAPLRDEGLRADRDGDTLVCRIHAKAAIANIGGRPAFPYVPENAVVVEVWVPAP